ncbi:ribonucleoside triphosphate reductase [Labilibaculum filiforme]|uniref:Ribonucleoside triphosphate reductase n=1 Tax=Labilibaculum filiforme TaxID=1940526 RepID=A0A2N3I1I5_9BACT|nr:ribonucleoside triphosphate reductase [Labilibaculum filiforme]PKQ64186.1 ribonucleoside triphosphate reductase [Labilibaculum filiforme]
MKINGSVSDSQIRKRNGQVVEFKLDKINKAIAKAFRAVGEERTELIEFCVKQIEKDIQFDGIPNVEEIQDLVERTLFRYDLFEVAKAFILYRKQHESVRDTKELFSNLNLVDDYLNLQDWRVKESANSSYSLQGLNQHISTIVSSQYWLNKIYPQEIGDAHKNGAMHIHDLGFLSVYCVGWDLQDLIITGFKGASGKLVSKPAKHFRTILGQVVNFFYTMQGEAAGAQAFSNFDTLLAPFIRFDQLDRKQVKQALQEFMFNVNVPTRVGFQTPFTNVTMDLNVPAFMKDEPVIIGGKAQELTYGDFQAEMDIFNALFAEVIEEGDANGSVFSFPIPTYNITSDFDWNKPEYENIWRITAKYGIPYFSNFVNSDLSPDDVRSMCCRLRLDKRELARKGGGLFGANPLTGSVGVVTINLPRLGYESSNEVEFFKRLARLMELGKNSLEIKRKVIENLTENGLFPYSKFYLRHLKQRNGKFWQNHFSTIGIVGMNECCLNFIGSDLVSEEGNAFALRIFDFMKQKLQEFQEETGNIYNLEATPAEGTTYRLAQLDTKTYKDIIVANQENYQKGAAPYYTNSSQLPVAYTDDLFEALSLQDQLQTQYTGGTVFHTFIGEKQLSIDAVKLLLQKITGNYHLPYITLSPTFSICHEHGYIYGEHELCPKCANLGKRTECEVFSRIVGYLRPVHQWNEGKRQEFKERKLFDKRAIVKEVILDLV